MRSFPTGLIGLCCLLILAMPAQAISLYRSNDLGLYTLAAEAGADNAHPADFVDAEALAQLLASLQIDSTEAGETVYLMSENRALKAGAELATALGRVDAQRDVLLVSYRNIGSFPTARRLATGARIFVEDGRLNLIFGQVETFIDEFREPQRKLPKHGDRAAAQLSGGQIRPADWFEFKPGRRDWVMVPLKTTGGPRRELRLDAATPATPVAPVAPAVPAAPVTPATPVAPAPLPASPDAETAAPIADPWQNLETGLETLQRLRQKGLISESEYQDRRRTLFERVGL